MNYQVSSVNNKEAGQLNQRGHLISASDQNLQHVYFKMQSKGITVLSAPNSKPKDGIHADAATTIPFQYATPEQIFLELNFQGFKVAPQEQEQNKKATPPEKR